MWGDGCTCLWWRSLSLRGIPALSVVESRGGKGSHRPKGCRHSLVAFEYLTQLSKISVFKTPREGKIEPRDVLFQTLVLCICSCKTASIHGLDALSRGLAMLCLVARTLLSPEQGRKPAFSGCYFCSYCPVVKPQALPLSWC